MCIVQSKLVQCVPNFSEGRDLSKLRGIAAAIEESGARLLDWSADSDHNRSVFTYIGSPNDVKSASLAAAAKAVEQIDIGLHEGVHPRIGVVDVLPFVPLSNVTMDECAMLARETGVEISRQWDIPVFFYGHASEDRLTLPAVRTKAFDDLFPSAGPLRPHPTAGAIAIGARGPLIAFNVNLSGGSISTARQIARDLRARFPGAVRALGLFLRSRNLCQVSMNIVRPDVVSLYQIVQFIAERSEILESELIGVMPGFSAFTAVKEALKMSEFKPTQLLLENWPEYSSAN